MFTIRIVHNVKRATTAGIGDDTIVNVPPMPSKGLQAPAEKDEMNWAKSFTRGVAVQYVNDVCYLRHGGEVVMRCEYSEI